MKTKLMFVMMAVLICSWASASVASGIVAQVRGDGSGVTYVPTDRDDVEIWCQEPDPAGTGVASQEDTDYPFEAWTADDYVSPGDEAVTKVQWWGVHFNDPVPPAVVPDYFVISFYNHDGTCDPGLSAPGVPTLPLYERVVTTFTFTDLGDGLHFEYTADVDPVFQDAGRTYWISIQAGMFFNPDGQWGWTAALAQGGCPATQLFPLIGDPFFAPFDPPLDMAFCLYYDGEDPIAVEPSSWGAVKALYK